MPNINEETGPHNAVVELEEELSKIRWTVGGPIINGKTYDRTSGVVTIKTNILNDKDDGYINIRVNKKGNYSVTSGNEVILAPTKSVDEVIVFIDKKIKAAEAGFSGKGVYLGHLDTRER